MIRRPLREIHEIELSSVCNLACVYCPHPTLRRPKAHMAADVFRDALAHVKHYCRHGTQGEVSLTGIGEAILHPAFIRMLEQTREVIGDRDLVLSTNGVAVTDSIARALAEYSVKTYVSLHRPEVAAPAIERLKRYGVAYEVNHAFVDRSIDWAGQVDWHASGARYVCDYLRLGWGVVRQCGSVDACCMDAHDLHPIGHVTDDPGSLHNNALPLCGACNLTVPEEFRDGC